MLGSAPGDAAIEKTIGFVPVNDHAEGFKCLKELKICGVPQVPVILRQVFCRYCHMPPEVVFLVTGHVG